MAPFAGWGLGNGKEFKMAMARYDARRALLTGGLLSVVMAAAFLAFDTKASPLSIDLNKIRGANPVPPLMGVGASILIGMGLGSVLTLLRGNLHRLRAVLRPNLGRVITAIVFGVLLPFSQFWAIPMTFLFVVAEFFGSLVTGTSLSPALSIPLYVFVGIVLPVTYVISSLIISGVRSRLVRVALFGQVWLATYGATLLIFGFFSGNL